MWRTFALVVAVLGVLNGCAYFRPKPPQQTADSELGAPSTYLVGPGDSLQVFVWRNPELTVTVPVRPDGGISMPLLQNVQAAGKTPAALGKDIKDALQEYVQNPVVTVIVQTAAGASASSIRVVGQALNPQLVPYRAGITLLDVMTTVGGLSEFADGNRAVLVRKDPDGKYKQYRLRINSLIKRGNMRANVELAPGDIIRIPERWF
jgi:polysaccharide export outer membrane protein